VEYRFFNPPRERKIGLKNWVVSEIKGRITMFDWGRETTFGSTYCWFELLGGSKNIGFKKSGFQCQ